MSNIEHLVENGLVAADEAHKTGKDASKAFFEEMSKEHNRRMLMRTLVAVDELWEIVQYVLFTWEVNR